MESDCALSPPLSLCSRVPWDFCMLPRPRPSAQALPLRTGPAPPHWPWPAQSDLASTARRGAVTTAVPVAPRQPPADCGHVGESRGDWPESHPAEAGPDADPQNCELRNDRCFQPLPLGRSEVLTAKARRSERQARVQDLTESPRLRALSPVIVLVLIHKATL